MIISESFLPHLEMIHIVAGVDFDPSKDVRKNKEAVLEKLGFSHGTNVAKKEPFKTKGDMSEAIRLVTYAREQFSEGRYLALLVMRDTHGNSGGCPVVYLMGEKDLDAKIKILDDEAIAISQGGKPVNLCNETSVQTYSRKRSDEALLSGFNNYKEPQNVRLGGGFRLQIDDIRTEDSVLKITCSGAFSFNDMGSRVLALSSDDDELVPRYSTNFDFTYDENTHLLKLDTNLKQKPDTGSVASVTDTVVGNLMDKDGEAIASLFREMLSVKAVTGVHQLEGIYSVVEGDVSAEIIDFDGVDSLDSSKNDLQTKRVVLSPEERLTLAKIANHDFTVPEVVMSEVRDYENHKNLILEALQQVTENPALDTKIKDSLLEHINNSKEIFTRDLTGPVKLARLLKAVGLIDSIEVASEQVYGDNRFYLFNIGGFEMAYWLDDDILVDTSDISSIKDQLSQTIGRDIVQAHVNSLREGD